MSEWIRMDELKPESGFRYLCYCNDIVSGWIKTLDFIDGFWVYYDDSRKAVDYPAIVTHWMPLPNPPETI